MPTGRAVVTGLHGAAVRLGGWLPSRDRNLLALRRGARSAVVAPAMFALADKVIGSGQMALFAAFGSLAMLMFVDFSGPHRHRTSSYLLLALCGVPLISLGTLVSGNAYLATACMVLVGFVVLLTGAASFVLAGASTSLLLLFVLPVASSAPVSAIPPRLAGWGLAAAAATPAAALLWPAPNSDPLRAAASRACRAVAAKLLVDCGPPPADWSASNTATTLDETEAAAAVVESTRKLRHLYRTTPYRPAGLSTAGRSVIRLMDQIDWLGRIASLTRRLPDDVPANEQVRAVVTAIAELLVCSAEQLEGRPAHRLDMPAALDRLDRAAATMRDTATVRLPAGNVGSRGGAPPRGVSELPVKDFLGSLDTTFRAQELGYAARQIARNTYLVSAADGGRWIDRLLGRRPADVPPAWWLARRRVVERFRWHSAWLHNSVRGAVALGLAVLVADLSGVQHSFWVVLAALSVLRTSALGTGQNVLRAAAGTVVGFGIGAALLVAIGTSQAVLWGLLPVVVLIAGVAPSVISFAAGQTAFTVTVVILFNIIVPEGWRVGVLRVEDVGLGCAISLLVGLLFWPRGAGRALARAIGDAYLAAARYLASAVAFGSARCDASAPTVATPAVEASAAIGAAGRLDDAFRDYLAERGAKPIPLSAVGRLVTGVSWLRLAADATLDLWRDTVEIAGERTDARRELLSMAARVERWYGELAASVTSGDEVPHPQDRDHRADERLVRAIRCDLSGPDEAAGTVAVRMIWTADHLNVARMLQAGLVDAARLAARRRTDGDRARVASGVAGAGSG